MVRSLHQTVRFVKGNVCSNYLKTLSFQACTRAFVCLFVCICMCLYMCHVVLKHSGQMWSFLWLFRIWFFALRKGPINAHSFSQNSSVGQTSCQQFQRSAVRIRPMLRMFQHFQRRGVDHLRPSNRLSYSSSRLSAWNFKGLTGSVHC